MTRTPSGPDRRTRLVAIVLVAALHAIAGIALIRAFTPEFAASVVRSVTRAVDITLPPPRPSPPPSPTPSRAAPAARGASGAAGRKAAARDAPAPRAELAIRPTAAPPVAGRGREEVSGAAAAGPGTGAGGAGTGAGSGGSGQGGGASPTVKLAGEISSAKDYPRKSRDLRIGASVTIDLTVGTDGSVRVCRIVRASPDPEADRITCQLAVKRFRFRPALSAAGTPVEATYRWTQRWFY